MVLIEHEFLCILSKQTNVDGLIFPHPIMNLTSLEIISWSILSHEFLLILSRPSYQKLKDKADQNWNQSPFIEGISIYIDRSSSYRSNVCCRNPSPRTYRIHTTNEPLVQSRVGVKPPTAVPKAAVKRSRRKASQPTSNPPIPTIKINQQGPPGPSKLPSQRKSPKNVDQKASWDLITTTAAGSHGRLWRWVNHCFHLISQRHSWFG